MKSDTKDKKEVTTIPNLPGLSEGIRTENDEAKQIIMLGINVCIKWFATCLFIWYLNELLVIFAEEK